MTDRTATERQQRRFLHTGSKQWRAIRQQVLDREPLCRDCAARGLVTVATEVDHIAGDTADNRLEALMPLCKPCHSHKTACELAGVPLKGCDVHGYPLDPRHPWSVLWNVGGRRD
jgi:5-methylcytosine-specific restriction endonuclease McrA